jgi:hypothetical protein
MTLSVSQKGEGGAVTVTAGTSNVPIAIVTTEPATGSPLVKIGPSVTVKVWTGIDTD